MVVVSIVVFVTMFMFAPFYAENALKDVALIDRIHSVGDVTMAIRLVSFSLLFVPMLAFGRGFLQGFQEMATTAKSQIIEQLARVIFLLVGVYLCLYVFDLGTTNAVYTALFAALVGAVAGYFIVFKRTAKQRSFIAENIDSDYHDVESSKTIIKKLILFSTPFILLSVIINLYAQVNTLTTVNVLSSIGYTVEDASSVLNALTLWGPKLNRLVFAFTIGFNTALLPSISSDYAKNDLYQVKIKTEKSFQLILLLVGFLSVFCSVFSKEIFTFFFETSVWGPVIFRVSIYTTLFHSFMYITSVILQATKHAYISIATMFIGWIFKLMLNEPLVHLLNTLGLEAGHGLALATMIGFFVTIVLNIFLIKKFVDINLYVLGRRLFKLLIIIGITFGLTILLRFLVPFTPVGRIQIFIYLAFFGTFSLSIYLGLGFYSKLIQRALGKDVVLDIQRKLKAKIPFMK
jgi:O-antigen/teichoic acid export membrane protein